ncbi:MAG TPA: ATP-binding cassette domain-containing protein [Solirubrobacterales bacterium]|nr:ATP-binding cassette domain-containing protein [Solirubrobacterales bacterium]
MLELRDLSKRYADVLALDRVSLDVGPGEISGFVGPNGAGKTTAMRIILGVLVADSGVVAWEGRPLDAESRRRIGYMPEERGLYPKMRAGDQLRYFAELHGLGPDDAAASAERWMERLGVADRAGDAVEELSLGNQQRVQLGAALVHSPDLLVLDEPFSGLDPVGVEVLADVLTTESRERGLPVIFSSHQLDLVERLCDSVAIIRSGRLVASGGVDELREGRAENLWEIEIAGQADPLDGLPGAHQVGPGLVALDSGVDPQSVLDHARRIGAVERFGRHRTTLAELFREVIADDRP